MFKAKIYNWLQSYFYRPNLAQKSVSCILLPLSFLYCFIIYIKKFCTRELEFNLPIISIGNLTLGGSGKTPLGIAIANEFEGGFVILRGYKRESKGMIKVCINGKILVDVKASGDEAMEYAKYVKNANVIVSEKRDIAINEAQKLGAKYIILDDGFGKFGIKKFNILIKPTPTPARKFCIPSGAYRYPINFYKFADFIAEQDVAYCRKSEILHPTKRMVLVSAIANPMRLEPFFIHTIKQIFYPDHYSFTHNELEKILKKYNATSLLVTQKDLVKIEHFDIPTSLITLKTTLCDEFKNALKTNLL